jgi:hypothetical protein
MDVKVLFMLLGLAAVIAFTALIYNCESNNGIGPSSKTIESSGSFETIVVVDGCQYARFDNYYDGGKTFTYTHLGTCTNCWAKLQRLIGKKDLEKEP